MSLSRYHLDCRVLLWTLPAHLPFSRLQWLVTASWLATYQLLFLHRLVVFIAQMWSWGSSSCPALSTGLLPCHYCMHGGCKWHTRFKIFWLHFWGAGMSFILMQFMVHIRTKACGFPYTSCRTGKHLLQKIFHNAKWLEPLQPMLWAVYNRSQYGVCELWFK